MQSLALILHDIRSTYNVGSIFRSAECFGVNHIFICGYTPFPLMSGDSRLPHLAKKIDNQIAKTALGAESKVPFSVHESIEDSLAEAQKSGYSIAAIEQDTDSTKIENYMFQTPVALVVGNEVDGVSEWTKAHCDVILEIKQYGTKESLNVASATAIALYAARTNIEKHHAART